MSWRICYYQQDKEYMGGILTDYSIAQAWINKLTKKYGKNSHWLTRC